MFKFKLSFDIKPSIVALLIVLSGFGLLAIDGSLEIQDILSATATGYFAYALKEDENSDSSPE